MSNQDLDYLVKNAVSAELIKKLFGDNKKKLKEDAREELDLYMRSKEYRRVLRQSVRSAVKDFLFDDIDWINWKLARDFVNKKLARGLR